MTVKTAETAPVARGKLQPNAEDRGVKLLSTSVLRGCNRYDDKDVILQGVDLGALSGQSSNRADSEFPTRYLQLFDNLDPAQPEGDLDKSFAARLRSGESLPFDELLFQAILAVERAAARAMRRLQDVGFSRIVAGLETEQVTFVWRSHLPEVSRRAARAGLIGFTEILPDELIWPSMVNEKSFAAALSALLKRARGFRPLPPAAILVDAAERKGIPWETVSGNIIRLGQGRFQQRIWSTVTAKTSRVGDRLAQDKVATHRVLADVGLPVPGQRLVGSVRAARAAAEEIGYPVVVKPLGGNTGKGVSANLKSRGEILAAFNRAREVGGEVIVENFVEGRDHRLLVVDGRLAAAALRVPPSVTGDGVRTIAQLVEALNADPLRDNFRRARIKLDQELNRLLDLSGYDLATVLKKGESFLLRSTANVSTGGFTIDVTEIIHPDNEAMAILAAEAVGLDVAGVDFLTTDIARSYREVGGGIVEVNSRPGLRPHIWPVEGKSRDVGSAVIETMFPPGEQGRVPIALVAGSSTRVAQVAAKAAALLRASGRMTVLSQEPEETGEAPAEDSPQSLPGRLRDHRLEMLVRSDSYAEVLRRGLLLESCEAALALDLEEEDAAGPGLETLLRATRGQVIVDADGAFPETLESWVGSSRLLLVGLAGENALVQRHLEAGGRAVVARKKAKKVMAVFRGPSLDEGAESDVVMGVSSAMRWKEAVLWLYALALAHAMGLSVSEIGQLLSNGLPATDKEAGPIDHHLSGAGSLS